jgi:hypothetical protein
MKTFVGVLIACSLFACGGDDKENLIGEACTKSSDCDVSGLCITSGKAGLCSQTCEVPGGAMQCPLGAYCDRLGLTTETMPDKTDMTVCLPACDSQSDCRSGYTCNGVSGGPGKVCQPD